MSRASRREKAEGELEHLEERFRQRLISALRVCASGQWGLFGQNDAAQRNISHPTRSVPAEVVELLELGNEIDALRASLGFTDGNTLYARLKALRRLRTASAPQEPRLAQQFLAEIEAIPDSDTDDPPA